MADQSKNKRLPIITGIVAGAAIIVLLVLFLPQLFNIMGTGVTSPEIEKPDAGNEDNGQALAEEIDKILENDRLVDTLSCFYYPGSRVKSFQSIGDEGDFLYILLEVDKDFAQVEEFYKNKRIQSIWGRAQLYEKSLLDLEQQFLEDENTTLTSKYTYHSIDKDKVVNVLINSTGNQATKVMVIYWEL